MTLRLLSLGQSRQLYESYLSKKTLDSSDFLLHEVLQYLKTFIYTNFQFESVLRFVIEGA